MSPLFLANWAVRPPTLVAISLSFSTGILRLLAISVTMTFHIAESNSVSCLRLLSLILLSKKGSTALLYLPWRITSICTPLFSWSPLKKRTSEERPRSATLPS